MHVKGPDILKRLVFRRQPATAAAVSTRLLFVLSYEPQYNGMSDLPTLIIPNRYFATKEITYGRVDSSQELFKTSITLPWCYLDRGLIRKLF